MTKLITCGKREGDVTGMVLCRVFANLSI
jgi:hypothetical protein